MKNSLRVFVVLSLVSASASFSGCATSSGAEDRENVQKLKVGMGENQVMNLLGTPDSVVRPSDAIDRWVYEYKNEAQKGHNLFVEFKNGELTHSGEMNGRDVAAAQENGTSGTCTHWGSKEFRQESLCTR